MEPQEDQRLVRLQKLEALRTSGVDPFAPERFERTHLARVFHEEACREGERVSVAGRIASMRAMGKVVNSSVICAGPSRTRFLRAKATSYSPWPKVSSRTLRLKAL